MPTVFNIGDFVDIGHNVTYAKISRIVLKNKNPDKTMYQVEYHLVGDPEDRIHTQPWYGRNLKLAKKTESEEKLKPDYYYDKPTRSWVLMWKDSKNNQVGEAEYYATRPELKRRLKSEGFSMKLSEGSLDDKVNDLMNDDSIDFEDILKDTHLR